MSLTQYPSSLHLCLPTLVLNEVAKDPVPGKMLAFSDSLTTRSGHWASFPWVHETQIEYDGASSKALALMIKKGLLAWNSSVMTGATAAILLPEVNFAAFLPDQERTQMFP